VKLIAAATILVLGEVLTLLRAAAHMVIRTATAGTAG
jgi:hypothetical protein